MNKLPNQSNNSEFKTIVSYGIILANLLGCTPEHPQDSTTVSQEKISYDKTQHIEKYDPNHTDKIIIQHIEIQDNEIPELKPYPIPKSYQSAKYINMSAEQILQQLTNTEISITDSIDDLIYALYSQHANFYKKHISEACSNNSTPFNGNIMELSDNMRKQFFIHWNEIQAVHDAKLNKARGYTN